MGCVVRDRRPKDRESFSIAQLDDNHAGLSRRRWFCRDPELAPRGFDEPSQGQPRLADRNPFPLFIIIIAAVVKVRLAMPRHDRPPSAELRFRAASPRPFQSGTLRDIMQMNRIAV